MTASLSALPFECPPALETALRNAYATPPRAYHDFSHVEEMLGHMACVPHWDNPVSVALAELFHDAIYEAGRPDNESRSAEFAARWIDQQLSHVPVDVERVQPLILLTARHGRLSRAELDPEAALFLDCDVAILGADTERYAAYEAGIAHEYRAVPPEMYRVGRAHFLKSVLAKSTIYLSDFFTERLEAKARRNLERALRVLET